jgi:F-type H+-transporting ATPase subunit gamma
MAHAKEIRQQIRSVRSTQKITRAMEMVAASKIRRAQDRLRRSAPYAAGIEAVVRRLARVHPEFSHPFLVPRPARSLGILIVSTDRGLCGGLNVNLFRLLLQELRRAREENQPVAVASFGIKASVFVRRLRLETWASVSGVGDSPRLTDVVGPLKVMADAYREGRIDRLVLLGNRFVNTMVQQPTANVLLPLTPSDEKDLPAHWDYLYEPDGVRLIDTVLNRYLEAQVYHALVENACCEQAARMVAMKSASENAAELINRLELAYNKARQAAITREISEIVAGAEAV